MGDESYVHKRPHELAFTIMDENLSSLLPIPYYPFSRWKIKKQKKESSLLPLPFAQKGISFYCYVL
jgi:hypothetical protein